MQSCGGGTLERAFYSCYFSFTRKLSSTCNTCNRGHHRIPKYLSQISARRRRVDRHGADHRLLLIGNIGVGHTLL